jgi:hypothetical protein
VGVNLTKGAGGKELSLSPTLPQPLINTIKKGNNNIDLCITSDREKSYPLKVGALKTKPDRYSIPVRFCPALSGKLREEKKQEK